jgi:hypothetical protein
VRSYRNTGGSTKAVGYCAHLPTHKKGCPNPRAVNVPPGSILTFDENAANGPLITAACEQAGLTPMEI